MGKLQLLVDNVNTKILGNIPNKAVIDIAAEVSYEVKTYSSYSGEESYIMSLFKYLDQTYPTGLFPSIAKILKKYTIEYEIVDKRERADTLHSFNTGELCLRDYQNKILVQALKAKRGVIQIATGGGKTELATKLIAEIGRPTIFLVHTYDLLHQTADRFEKYYNFKVGRVSGNECEISDKVNVCMIQTLHSCLKKKYVKFDDEEEMYKETSSVKIEKIKEMMKNCDVIIVDEGHKIAAQSYVNIMEEVNCFYRFCMTATPKRSDGKTIHLEAYTGKKLSPITASYLIKRNYLVQPIIYMCKIYKSNYIYIKHKRYQTVYKEYVVENEHRNKIIAFLVKRLVKSGKKVLITVTYKKHGKILLKLIKAHCKDTNAKFLYSNVAKDERTKILNDMREGKINVLIGTSLADEGLDIPILDALILAGAGKSVTRIPQRIGCVLRKYDNKKLAYVFDFHDSVRYLRGQVRERREIYKSEPAFIVKEKDYTK